MDNIYCKKANQKLNGMSRTSRLATIFQKKTILIFFLKPPFSDRPPA